MADEFSDKLSAVLGNPEAMGQIMSIARALTGDSDSAPPAPEAPAYAPVSEPQPPAPIQPAPQAQAQPQIDLSGIMGMLGSLTGGGQSSSGGGGGNPLSALGDLDPRLIQTGMRLLSEYNSTDDRKTALLTALRPFVKEERFAKVDRAIQIARLSRVIRVALHVFKESGGGTDDV